MGKPASGPSCDISDTARHRALSVVSRVRILNLVRRSGAAMAAAEVVAATGLHPNTVRAHLDQLAETGLVSRSRQADGSPGRPAWRYRAVDRPTDQADLPYRELARALIGHLARTEEDPQAAGLRAGRAWGRALAASLGRTAPLPGLLRVLERLGFTPTVAERPDEDSAVIHLNSCPYLEMAETSPDVVCGVHLGVIGGALGALGTSAAGTELKPFAAPGRCIVRVRTPRSVTAPPEDGELAGDGPPPGNGPPPRDGPAAGNGPPPGNGG